MGKEPINMWPYLSQFVTHLTDFTHLEVFRGMLYGQNLKIHKIDFVMSSLHNFVCSSQLVTSIITWI